MGKTYWYCPYCGEEVDPQNVTYQEMHEDCGHPVTLVDDSLPTYNQLQAENTRLREAITEFAKADKVLRRDYTEYCDEEGYPPDWVYEEDEAFHDMWDKAVANLLDIAEESLKEGNDEGE